MKMPLTPHDKDETITIEIPFNKLICMESLIGNKNANGGIVVHYYDASISDLTTNNQKAICHTMNDVCEVLDIIHKCEFEGWDDKDPYEWENSLQEFHFGGKMTTDHSHDYMFGLSIRNMKCLDDHVVLNKKLKTRFNINVDLPK